MLLKQKCRDRSCEYLVVLQGDCRRRQLLQQVLRVEKAGWLMTEPMVETTAKTVTDHRPAQDVVIMAMAHLVGLHELCVSVRCVHLHQLPELVRQLRARDAHGCVIHAACHCGCACHG